MPGSEAPTGPLWPHLPALIASCPGCEDWRWHASSQWRAEELAQQAWDRHWTGECPGNTRPEQRDLLDDLLSALNLDAAQLYAGHQVAEPLTIESLTAMIKQIYDDDSPHLFAAPETAAQLPWELPVIVSRAIDPGTVLIFQPPSEPLLEVTEFRTMPLPPPGDFLCEIRADWIQENVERWVAEGNLLKITDLFGS